MSVRNRLLDHCILAVGVLLLCLGSGCSRGPEIVDVSGKLTRQGKPLAGYIVRFAPVDGRRYSMGVTREDGDYQLRYTMDRTGVLVGRHKVILSHTLIDYSDPRTLEKLPAETRELVAKYGHESTTPLEVDVPGKRSVKIDLEVE